MTNLAILTQSLEVTREGLTELAALIETITSLEELALLKTKMKLVREWVVAHDKIKSMRKELLRAEIAALVQIYRLGGSQLLNTAEAQAAARFAAMTPEELEAAWIDVGGCTTAVGFFRNLGQTKARQEWPAKQRARGREIASDPDVPDWWTDGPHDIAAESGDYAPEAWKERDWSYARVDAEYDIKIVLRRILHFYTEVGAPFTVQDVADALIEETASTVSDEFMEGVREVVRTAIRSSPVFVGDERAPEFITTRVGNSDPNFEKFLRIPFSTAKMAHLEDMIAFRKDQLRFYLAALERLEKIHARLATVQTSPDDELGYLADQLGGLR